MTIRLDTSANSTSGAQQCYLPDRAHTQREAYRHHLLVSSQCCPVRCRPLLSPPATLDRRRRLQCDVREPALVRCWQAALDQLIITENFKCRTVITIAGQA